MTPSSAVRSFAITVAIAIAIIGPQASGFTINRTSNITSNNTVETKTKYLSLNKSYQLQVKNDLSIITKKDDSNKTTKTINERGQNETETTTMVEVKNDLTSPNDIKTIKNEDSNKSTKTINERGQNETETTTMLEIKNDLRSPNDIKKEDSNQTTKTNNERGQNEIETTTMLEFKTDMTPRVDNKQKRTEIWSTTENTKIPTISSDTVEVFDSVEHTTNDKNNANAIKINTESSEQNSQEKDKKKVITLKHKNSKTTTTESYSKTQLSIEISMLTDQIATDSETSDQTTQKSGVTITSDMSETTTGSLETAASKETSTWIPVSVTDITGVFTADFLPNSSETTFPATFSNAGLDLSTQVYLTSSDFEKTETVTDIPDTEITDPLWKKYTTIIRKRITSSEDISPTANTKDETMKAETSNSYMNFDKAFNVTPIPSLEKLRIDLLSNTKQLITNTKTVSEETRKTTVAIDSTIPSSNTGESTGANRTGTVQTKRAGYLDYSEKATTPLPAVVMSIEKIENGTIDYIRTTESESQDFKKASGAASQSLMAEDAMKEELMKETILYNQQENVNRYGVENEVKSVGDEALTLGITPPLGPEYSLSVQPISNERTKTTLYTVSPHYKPMKKIDVQAAKPFVRDPDDNSWRNESISSLGIVFKPKNSSKSFKEVLKNKTQTELNNLQEKDTKDDLPDLRVRLEKIAEVRKTKKKKMNKDGEEIYTDYEESNSAEGSRLIKPGSSMSGLGSGEISLTTSTPSNSQPNPELTTPMTSWMQFEANNAKTMNTQDLFKNLGLDPQTTKKPKKFYNIAEYYDTTDEYDADYITMSKLDLQKFTAVPRLKQTTMRHRLEPLMTSPIEPYLPERKPTVQYFPPRRPQKVNVNNADRNFERKINQYTLKPPKIEPQPPFVTVPPAGIATDRPEIEPDTRHLHPHESQDDRPRMRYVRPDYIRPPDMRPITKPTDFTMYTPADLSKNYYLTNAPRVTDPHEAFPYHNVGSINRGSYVIKHYKDFLNAAVKDNDDERDSDYLPFTETPREVTVDETEKPIDRFKDEYDDDPHFRKDVLNRFIDNFNQNSERFKVDFPILYNNSIVHRKFDESGRVASSRTFLKRLYNSEGTATRSNSLLKKPCEPNCDLTVELSPAYELHYYVPDQEEKEEVKEEAKVEAKEDGAPRYRLAL